MNGFSQGTAGVWGKMEYIAKNTGQFGLESVILKITLSGRDPL
jgi:hypothetical protein